jgi:hypothetical protein
MINTPYGYPKVVFGYAIISGRLLLVRKINAISFERMD